MEGLVREMQDPEAGVPVRSQKLFLTSIPSAFMGKLRPDRVADGAARHRGVEALNISNQRCMHGYFSPVTDTKTRVVKDDSSLYRFQTPYYWPWQQKAPDQIEYAIYLAKRSLRNKQRHGLEDYEAEALASLHKNLKGKWDFITMQAEEQVRLAKERKKGDKIVGDSQERAYWRVHRPPRREVEILKASLGRNRVKMSQACECNVAYYETFSEYDPMMNPPLPSNPWVTEDVSFWQMNGPVVEVPTEKRVKRWGISIEEVVSDPTGLQEFTAYLKKEYSHENIRFWMAVNDLRRSSHSQIFRKVKEIYEEFLEPGAPCEINIDGKTMEKVQQGLKNPSRFAFDLAAEHIYMLLLKKDCYPRFVRSEHYKTLMANAIQPSHKKRFFGFGGGAKKKGSTATAPNPSLLTQPSGPTSGNINSLSKRRGSDRSLSGSAHELAVCGVKDATKVPHSHSQSNLSDIPYSVAIYRGDMPYGGQPAAAAGAGHEQRFGKQEVTGKTLSTTLEVTLESGGGSSAVCPWDSPTATAKPPEKESTVSVSVCPWDDGDVKLPSESKPKPPASDISEVSERMKRSCGLRQNTLDGDFHSTKRLAPVVTEQRRASMTMAPRLSDLQFSLRANSGGESPPGPPVLQQQRSFDHPRNVSQSSLSTSFEEREDSSATPTASDENLARQKKESISELEEPAEELGAAAGLGARASDVGEPTRTDVEMNTNITRASEQCTCQVATQTRTNITPVGGGGEVVNKSRAVTPGSEGQGLCVEAGAQRRGSVCEQPQPPTISVCFANSEAEEEDRRRRRSLGNTGDRSLDEDHGEAEEVYFTSEEADDDAGSMGYTRLPDPPAPQDMSPLAEDDNFSESFSQPNQSSLEQVEYDIMMDGDNLAPETTASDHTETAVTVHVTTRERQEQEPEASAGATVVIIEDQVKRRKRKERKERGEKEAVQQQRSEEENSEKKGNAVCPWDDEDESAADEAPYVKTYSTLGYL
ncbi:hypothetical protein quinque_014676 [Culex quinquefasciatus]